MKRIIFMLLLLVGCLPAFAQITVTGEVQDEHHEPLPGATLIVKGTKTATATDVEGKFTLKAKPGDVIVTSYVGYDTAEDVVPADGKMLIILKEGTTALDEIVVVGVSMKKSDLTGAVSHVGAETLTQKPVTTLSEALAGQVAGLSVGKATSPSNDGWVKIRGTNTINSGSNPIYVVDGLVVDNNMGVISNLNVNDIESVEILKDASATALYGSRGANGVIVITTKKGRSTNGTVTYDGWFSWSKPGHRPATMNAQQLFELRKNAFVNGYLFNNPDGDVNAYINNEVMNSNMVFEEREMATYKAGKSYNWLDAVTQTGFQQNHNISFAKSSDATNLFFSLGLTDLDGIMKGTQQRKYWGRINASANIRPWLRVGTNTSFTYTHDKMTSSDIYSQALYNGNPLLSYEPYRDDATRHNDENLNLFWRAQTGETINNFNPFNSFEVDIDRSRYQITSANYLEIQPISDLTLRSTFAVNHSEQKWNQFIPTGIQESLRHYSGEAVAWQQRFDYTQWQWDNTINYNHTWYGVHRLSALAGTSASRRFYSDLKAQGQRFASDDLGYNGLFGNANPDMRQISNDYSSNTLLSYVARANYSYDYRYFITLTGRWDGSSKFSTGHKWGFFPSFSLAWDVTNEKFFPKSWWVNQIKLRGGYGVVGNQDISDFMYYTLYSPRVVNDQPTYGTDGRRGTWGITWEKQKQTNIGIDLSFFDSRLNLTVDAFWIKNSNLLMSHSLPSTSGYSTTVENVGELDNKGFEFTLRTTPVMTRDFTWNFNLNFGLDRNKVTKLYGGVERILNGTSRTGNIFIGESLSNIYTRMSGGIANEWNRNVWEGVDYGGRTVDLGDLFLLDINGPDGVPDGVVDNYDRYIFGNTDPKFYGGFSTDLTWKGLTLNAVFDYSYGGHWLSGYYESLISSVGTSMASVDLLDCWTPQNTGAFFPRRVANATGYSPYSAGETDRYIQDTSYLRLSTLSLSYSLPKNIVKKFYFENLRVYFTASNVFTVTKYKGFDPYFGDGSGYFPTERTYTLGLSFTF